MANNDCVDQKLSTICDYLKDNNLSPILCRLFGESHALKFAAQYFEEKFRLPSLSIAQDDSENGNLSIQIWAVSKGNVREISDSCGLVGREYEDDFAKYLILNVLPDSAGQSRFLQAQNLFENATRILAKYGMDFSSTIRTWIYAKEILQWYDELNDARDAVFNEFGIFDKLVPASTGIGVANASEKAIAMQLISLTPKPLTKVTAVNSPLQCSAMDYKKSFSRAVQVRGGHLRRLFISGTASIDKDGNSVYLQDTSAQINRTMEVVEAILGEAKMDFTNAVSAIVYFKNRGDFALFDEFCLRNEINLAHVKVQSDVCRDELLFELELDAAKII